MPLGINDLKNISLPSAWDGNELSRLALADGTSYETVLRDIDDALTIANAEMMQTYYARLVYETEEVALEYRSGNTAGMEESTEYGKPDIQRANFSGHMLPMVSYDRALGWTRKFLKKCRAKNIANDIDAAIADAKDRFEKSVLTRLFKMEEETGRRYGLGASGYSVPFCDGGGGTIAFTPVNNKNRASAFAATHDHFVVKDGITQANLDAALLLLWEHGHDGPFELLVSLADISSWKNTTNVTGYVEKPDPYVQYGSDTALARVSDEFYTGGVKADKGFCRLVPLARIPTGYWAVTKSYGINDPRNPLALRADDGFGARLVGGSVSFYPINEAIFEFDFGVGVGEDRTAAVLVENDSSGDYATPTIG